MTLCYDEIMEMEKLGKTKTPGLTERLASIIKTHLRRHTPRIRIQDLRVLDVSVGESSTQVSRRVVVTSEVTIRDGSSVRVVYYGLYLDDGKPFKAMVVDDRGRVSPLVPRKMDPSTQSLAQAVYQKFLA